jgi:hypothetical protein
VQKPEWVGRGRNIRHSVETGLRAGSLSRLEKQALLERVLVGRERVTAVATAIGRRPDVLSKMLRKQAIKSGRAEEWTEVMKQMRRGHSARTQG